MTASRILKLGNFSVVLLPFFTEYCLFLGSLCLPNGIAVLERTRGECYSTVDFQKFLHNPRLFSAQFLTYFFVKKKPLSRCVGYVMDGSMMGE